MRWVLDEPLAHIQKTMIELHHRICRARYAFHQQPLVPLRGLRGFFFAMT